MPTINFVVIKFNNHVCDPERFWGVSNFFPHVCLFLPEQLLEKNYFADDSVNLPNPTNSENNIQELN